MKTYSSSFTYTSYLHKEEPILIHLFYVNVLCKFVRVGHGRKVGGEYREDRKKVRTGASMAASYDFYISAESFIKAGLQIGDA